MAIGDNYKQPTAKVVAHSCFLDNTEVITLEFELHRFILPEFNTHKRLSRNFQSSRAIPVLRQLDLIETETAMPLFYGSNEPGMVAGEELCERKKAYCEEIILLMRDYCMEGVRQLHALGLAKQTANRYIEPWMFTKGVATATIDAWKAFFKLRDHFAAQPEIQALAKVMKKAIKGSLPNHLDEDSWHTPYYLDGFWSPDLGTPLKEALMISASCCAQTSYRKRDESLDKAIDVFNKLDLPVGGEYEDDPPHYSPTEHQVVLGGFGDFGPKLNLSGHIGNDDFVLYRRLLEEGYTEFGGFSL